MLISNKVPDWRQAAPAGLSLARAQAAFDARNAASAPAQNSPLPPDSPAAKTLLPIIHPSVRDRWMSGVLAMYTPTLIENTIRGAMAGNLMSVWLMFDLMERTWPRLSKNLNELKLATTMLGWNMVPFALRGAKPTTEAQRRKRIIDQMIWTMRPDLESDENDFEDTLYDVMDGVGKGIALLQTDYERRAVNVATDPKGVQMMELWCPRATQWVHPRYYGYPSGSIGVNALDRLMLNTREILTNNPAAQIEATTGVWAEIPRDQFIVSIFKQKSGHPLGASMLAILGYWWAAQTFTWDWFLSFTQVFGMPIRWATYAPGVQQQTINGIMDMLEQMGNLAYGAFPAGTNLELKQGSDNAQHVPHKVMIDAADTICDVLILGQTLTTSQGERGSQSLGTIHNEVRQEKVMGCARRCAKILNVQMITALCRLNFGDDTECPQLVPVDRSGKDGLAVANRWKIILSTPGARVSRDQFNEENDIVPVDDDDDDVMEAQAGGAGQNGPGQPGAGGSSQDDPPEDLAPAQGRGLRLAQAHADGPGSDRTLVDNALADATGIAPRWLGAVRPIFDELIAKAKDGSVSDADFIKAVGAAQKELPGVFDRLDHKALERVIEQTMTAGVINGVVKGALQRRRA